LALDDNELVKEPYEHRRELLTGLGLTGSRLQVPPTIDGSAEHAVAVSKQMRAEGIVAKLLGSLYHPGRRSPDWIKTKHDRMQEIVIGGWRPGTGNREGRIGSLLMGIPTPEGLRYSGRVGTGFTDTILDQLAAKLRPLATTEPPFIPPLPREVTRDAHWVRPELVGEVRYAEWTGDHVLRHPVWRGLRPDKEPSDVVVE
ncbi:MAG: ATP-dependent DNA ligase, partial [Mycobacteriales bacterium]